jgi:flagellar biogenesis protein FliO
MNGEPVKILRKSWARLLWMRRGSERRLRLSESLPLGDRRFVAVVQYGQARFLLGGTSSSLVLLTRLEDGSGDDMSMNRVSPATSPAEGHA